MDELQLTVEAEGLFLLECQRFLLDPLEGWPLDVIPLYAMLTAVHHAIARRPNYPGIVASGQLANGLIHLGFEAELIPAHNKIYRASSRLTGDVEFDSWDIISSDAETGGHLAVWTPSFGRCIDLAASQDPMLTRGEPPILPMVFAMPGGQKQLLYQGEFVAERPPFVISCIFSNKRNSRFDPLIARHAAAIEHGGLSLAQLVVDLLSAFAIYLDLHPLCDLYPHLNDLLNGQTRLPDLKNYSYYRKSTDTTESMGLGFLP